MADTIDFPDTDELAGDKNRQEVTALPRPAWAKPTSEMTDEEWRIKVEAEKARTEAEAAEEREIVDRLLFILNAAKPGDSINASLLKELIKDDFRYNADRSRWYHYEESGAWRSDVARLIMARAREMCSLLFRVVSMIPWENREPWARHALKSDALPRQKAAAELASCDPALVAREEDFDSTRGLFNVKNGVIDTGKRTLLSHEPAFLLTQQAGCSFDPLAKALLWEKFLEQILPDPTVREYFQIVIGLALTGDMREQKFWVAYGGGENGKSTALETIMALFGDYGIEIDIDVLMESHRPDDGNSAKPGLVRLVKKRFVVAPENKKNQALKQGLIKKITGGDAVQVRELYERQFNFYPECQIIIMTNHKPRIPDGGVSLWRRLRLIPFTVRIPKAKQDKNLKEKLLSELPGVLNWALDGLEKYRAAGLPEPAAVQQATAEYEESQDTFAAFLAECLKTPIAEYNQVGAAEAFDWYRDWCGRNGEHAMSNKNFKLAMEEKGYVAKHTKAGNFFVSRGECPF